MERIGDLVDRGNLSPAQAPSGKTACGAPRCSSIRRQVGTLAGLFLLVPQVLGPAKAETWKADMQLNKVRSAELCLRGTETTYTLELAAGTLSGKAPINSFRARVAADGAVREEFIGELDQGLNTTVTTKMPRFTITGNAQARDLELAWPSGPCVWTLKPRE